MSIPAEFKNTMSKWGLPPLTAQAEAMFDLYLLRLSESNKQFNLTAIDDRDEIWLRHFADSLALLPAGLKLTGPLIDVGCGAGFPGLPLKIMNPDWPLTLLDSTGKKIDFLRRLAAEMGLSGVTCITGRAEEQPALRETFSLVVSRAVAPLPQLLELCLPFCKVGGYTVCYKGAKALDELAMGENAVKTLGGRFVNKYSYQISADAPISTLLIFEKLLNTPIQYPRPWSKINKSPL